MMPPRPRFNHLICAISTKITLRRGIWLWDFTWARMKSQAGGRKKFPGRNGRSKSGVKLMIMTWRSEDKEIILLEPWWRLLPIIIDMLVSVGWQRCLPNVKEGCIPSGSGYALLRTSVGPVPNITCWPLCHSIALGYMIEFHHIGKAVWCVPHSYKWRGCSYPNVLKSLSNRLRTDRFAVSAVHFW